MKLRDYLHFEEIKLSTLAKAVDYSAPHIRRYITRQNRLSVKIARRIEQFTEGKVTVEEILAGNPPKKNSAEDKNILQNTTE